MDPGTEQAAAWGEVASGWEARRGLVWEATRAVSERMVDLLDPQPGWRLLDLAGGVGETGFLALGRTAPGGSLLSTDVAPAMVEAAQRRARELELERVSFAVADAQSLELPDDSVDGVLCRFGVMLVPEPPRALSEIGRVLRPGGRAAAAVWADADRNDWATAAGRAALALGLIGRPDPDAPGPFRLADPERLRALIRDAGLAFEAEEEVEIVWRYPSLEDWWEVSKDLSRSLRVILADIEPAQMQAVRDGACARLRGYVDPSGAVAIPGVARVVLVGA